VRECECEVSHRGGGIQKISLAGALALCLWPCRDWLKFKGTSKNRRYFSDAAKFEDRNVAIEYRWADSRYDRLPALAADLVRRGVSVIATGSNINAAMAAKAATMTIPIVFLTGADPVKDGLVNSLNRPGGNLTGVTTLNVEIVPKRQSPLRATADRDPLSARHGVLLRAGRWDMRFLFVNELEDSFSGLVLRANRGTGCYRGHRSDSRKWGLMVELRCRNL
jgi:ABC transporter substrate binding protein